MAAHKPNLSLESELTFAILNYFIAEQTGEVALICQKEEMKWSQAVRLLEYHELFPALFVILQFEQSCLPEQVRILAKSYYYDNVLRQLRLWKEFLTFNKVCHDAGIEFVPLKGFAFLEDIYAYKDIRLVLDVDVLVRIEDYERVSAVLSHMGYKKKLFGLSEQYWLTQQCHVSFVPNQSERFVSTFEVHVRLDYPRKYGDLLLQLWRRRNTLLVDGRSIKILSPEDNFFSLVLHQRRLGKACNLKYILDVCFLLRKYRLSFDWDYVAGESIKGRMQTAVYFLLAQVRLVTGDLYISDAIIRSFIPSDFKQRLIKKRIMHNIVSPPYILEPQQIRAEFLRCHFLLYDNYWEPLVSIINIPLEQFAKYYDLCAYDRKTKVLYRIRLLYMAYKYFQFKFINLRNCLRKHFSRT